MNTKGLFSSHSTEWTTPQWLFDELNEEFNFTVDLCATKENRKCLKYYSVDNDGLQRDLTGERVFCNPPYGAKELPKWIKKCACSKCLSVMLLPARTDTKAFHDFIYKKAEIRFIKGRLHFGNSANSAPFPSMIVIFRNEEQNEKNI